MSVTPSAPPDASGTARGFLNTLAQTFAGVKTFANGLIASAAVTINSYLLVTGAPPGTNLTDGQNAYLGSYNNNIGSAALWLAVAPSTTNFAVACSTSGGLGTPVGTTLAGSPAIVMGRNGSGASDVCTKIGTSVADGSVNVGAKLLSVRTGIGGTEVERAWFKKSGSDGFVLGASLGSVLIDSSTGTHITWNTTFLTLATGQFKLSSTNMVIDCSAAGDAIVGTAAKSLALYSTLGSTAVSTTKVGTSVAHASVHADAHLLSVRSGITGTETEEAFVTTSNIEHTGTGAGIVLKSPDGARWRLTISNAGAVVVAAA